MYAKTREQFDNWQDIGPNHIDTMRADLIADMLYHYDTGTRPDLSETINEYLLEDNGDTVESVCWYIVGEYNTPAIQYFRNEYNIK